MGERGEMVMPLMAAGWPRMVCVGLGEAARDGVSGVTIDGRQGDLKRCTSIQCGSSNKCKLDRGRTLGCGAETTCVMEGKRNSQTGGTRREMDP